MDVIGYRVVSLFFQFEQVSLRDYVKEKNDIFLEFNVENIFLFYRAIKRYFLKYDFFVIK